MESARPSSSAPTATAARSAVRLMPATACAPETSTVSGDGSHTGIPRRRVGSSDGTGVTVIDPASTPWISGPSGPSATKSNRSALLAPATGNPGRLPSATATVRVPPAMDSSHGPILASAVPAASRSARREAASALVSTRGSGNATRPASSSRGTRSTRPRPKPPWASGTTSPVTPRSASVAHRGVRAVRAAGASNAARTASVVHSLARTWRTASRNSSWVSVNAKFMSASSAQPRGSPSMRSATTFRWISLVPA